MKNTNTIKKNRLLTLFKSLALAAVLFPLNSCDESFLERQPLDKISEADVWSDEKLIEAFVNSCYNVRHGFLVDYYMMPLSDEAYRRGRETYHLINRGELTPVNNTALDHWSNFYGIITNCNIFFRNIDKAPIGEPVKSRMIGEVTFMRAYAYFRLISLYGGVPLITDVFELNDDFSVMRNSYAECSDFIVQELTKASELLPLTYTGANQGRATKGAALALKARALLYSASPLHNPSNDKVKWQAAAEAAKAVVDMNAYSLYPNYKSLFLTPFNSEIIWSRQFRNNQKVEHSIDLHFFPNGSGGYGQVNPLHNLVDAFELKTGKLPAEDPAYNPQSPYENRDPRFYDCILYDGAKWQNREVGSYLPGGPDSSEGVEGWNASFTSYSVRKFVNESIGRPSATNLGNTPWVFIRYAEVLLNYAEAMYQLGDEKTAREYVNKVRSRESVQMPPVTETGANLLKRIQHERQIELVFEEHRFFDVRRWKIAMATDNEDAKKMVITRNAATGAKTYKVEVFQPRSFNERNHLIPIPQSEIERNAKLEQNPGY
ncbi:RagB/SusD family nutrient uptake outer membrane protein [Dyadobacter sp. CY323]|uniref:RagB/SusD family nutrient uptake outer membrane protein n=1 Tax=Dyadobacter sp. CY323 TaxID=2907302 RepID=UPI001F43D721|nr:RagB/SusD family nutrient uptake outer membrane protein [Dyadobacter sp. CY323]MCE6992459.1 RagB/SusD family nutrient uptake outer membrane protein [Dyadobacter sp. CY323]